MKNLITFDSAELFFEKVPLNERCKQGAAPVQPMNRFKQGVTTTESDVRKELEYQPKFSEVLDDIHILKTSKTKISDTALWSKVEQKTHRVYGPKKVQLSYYPQDENARDFLNSHYFLQLANNEFVSCQWLMYSKLGDDVFYFY